MSRLRFGVVGCGAISTFYQLPAIRHCSQVDLVAVVDTDLAWAQSVARRFGVRAAFASYRDLIGHVDAALVATPNHTHADIACGLLQAGVHVLCEKPMSSTRAEVERMFDVATRSGARLMAAHCLRFSPNLALLKQAIATGWLGDVRELSGGIGGRYESGTQRTDFRRQKQLAGGGVLLDLGIHLIDLAMWLVADHPVNVAYESTRAAEWEVETDAEVALEFGTGVRAMLASSFTRTLESALTVRGTAGWATAALYRPTDLTFFSRSARLCQHAGVQQLQLADESMYDGQIAHFCHAVQSGNEFAVRADEVRGVIDVIERCYRQQEAHAA
ncbi:MAG TPA: Gfo/Idh/MocA family oxidoreductase [Candidatus Binatia bacterium]|nr:Gfo/Idh/MocA family oxidoreductase [Candidatus Binatia bacterium]